MFNKFKILLVTLTLALSTGVDARGGGGGGGSHSSGGFSSGSRSSGSSSSGSRSSGSSSSGSKSSGGFSSGSKSSSGSSSSSSSSSKSSGKSSGSSYDKSASAAQSKQSSAQKYNAYRNPKADSALTSTPQSTIDSRPQRSQQVYVTYYSRPVPSYYYSYNDPYNAYFWMWLMDHPSYQAQWAYNHRDSMSDARYQELKAKNADLERQMNELKQNGTPKDPTYTPPGVDHDLMYSDEYVNSVKGENQPVVQEDETSWGWAIVLGLLGASALIFLVVLFWRD